MRLPSMRFKDQIKKRKQVQFGGLNHNYGAADGELWDMRNMTGEEYPLLASRRERAKVASLTIPGGLFSHNGLAWVDGTGFYYKGEQKGTVTAGRKTFAALGAYIIILPDKAYFNTLTDEFGSMESAWVGTSLTFTHGKLYEEDAENNTIQCSDVDWADYFKAGDAVTIGGCTKHPENNKTPIIREIDGDKLYFYEYVFTLDGEENDTAYTETGSLTIKRTVPDMLYLCENENRLWGCDRTTIYASKLGDIFNWNVYDGLETDSYAVSTGSAGDFTGCVSYLGYPVFFKADNIYKVYGDTPSKFQVMGSATMGIARGSAASAAVAGEVLFYLSDCGVVAYSGGIPSLAGEQLGKGKMKNAVGGSSGSCWYASMEQEDGSWLLYVYDTRKGLWHIEDETQAVGFARYDGGLYMLDSGGDLWLLDGVAPQGAQDEGPVEWSVEFADFYEFTTYSSSTTAAPEKKGVGKFQLRLELGTGASASVSIRYDSVGDWQHVSTMTATQKRSFYLPVVPRRCDHYRLKITGTGEFRLYSLTREYYIGSELRSIAGRQ